MLNRALIPQLGLEEELLNCVQERLEAGGYTDAILCAFRHVTNELREKSGETGDGFELIANALGGPNPRIRVNEHRTPEQISEQKGVEQTLRGLYMAIRNPRSHAHYEDSEDFCIRVLLMLDTLLRFIDKDAPRFDPAAFITKVLDPYGVRGERHAEEMVLLVPPARFMEVFEQLFAQQREGDPASLRHVFHACYQRMTPEQLTRATSLFAEALREETYPYSLEGMFALMRHDMWPRLPGEVRARIEHLVVQDCRRGHFDIYNRTTAGKLGRWGSYFGRYFDQKRELAAALEELLFGSWYAESYVGEHYLISLPLIAETSEAAGRLAEALAYAAVTNKADVVRTRLKEVSPNYPSEWKAHLRSAIQTRRDDDPAYAHELLTLLS